MKEFDMPYSGPVETPGGIIYKINTGNHVAWTNKAGWDMFNEELKKQMAIPLDITPDRKYKGQSKKYHK